MSVMPPLYPSYQILSNPLYPYQLSHLYIRPIRTFLIRSTISFISHLHSSYQNLSNPYNHIIYLTFIFVLSEPFSSVQPYHLSHLYILPIRTFLYRSTISFIPPLHSSYQNLSNPFNHINYPTFTFVLSEPF